MDWAEVAGIVGAATGVVALCFAWWNGKTSASSARTAEVATRIAEQSYALQRKQWEEDRRASLRIVVEHRKFEGHFVYLGLLIKNIGRAPAHSPEATIDYPGCLGGSNVGAPLSLLPEQTHTFWAAWNPPEECRQEGPVYWGKFVLRYEDIEPHRLEATYRLTSLFDPYEFGLSRLQVKIDGKMHPQGRPEETDLDRLKHRQEMGLAPPPGF